MSEPTSDLVRRIETLEAQAAIARLSADYCRGADLRDLELFLSVWADGAVWQVSEEVEFEGLEEIAGAIEKQWESTTRAFHWTSNPAITVNPDGVSARALFDVHTQVQLPDETWLEFAGTYVDDCIKVDGEWRFARRTAQVHSQRVVL